MSYVGHVGNGDLMGQKEPRRGELAAETAQAELRQTINDTKRLIRTAEDMISKTKIPKSS